MQNTLLISPLQFFGDAVARALAAHYLITVVPSIAVARQRREKNQLILLPIANLRDAEGFHFLGELAGDGDKVIALLLEKNPHMVRACIALGAYGMLESDASIVELKMKMDTVTSGQRAYAANLLPEAIQYYYDHLPILSAKDMAIVDLLCQTPQPNNADIAKKLKSSEDKIGNVLTQLFLRSHAKGRSELIKAMLSNGYFPGFNLLYPDGFNKSSDSVIEVKGSKKYALAFVMH